MFLLTKGQLIAGNTKIWIGTDTIKEVSFSDHVHNEYAPINHTHDQYLTEETVTPIINDTVASIPRIKVNLLEKANFNKTTESSRNGQLCSFNSSFNVNNVFGLIIDLDITDISCTVSTSNYNPNAIILHLLNDPINYYGESFYMGDPNSGKYHPGTESIILLFPVSGTGTITFNPLRRKLFIPYSVISTFSRSNGDKDDWNPGSTTTYITSQPTLRTINGPGTVLDNTKTDSFTSNSIISNGSTNNISNLKLLVCRGFDESGGSSYSTINTITIKGSCTVYTLSL